MINSEKFAGLNPEVRFDVTLTTIRYYSDITPTWFDNVGTHVMCINYPRMEVEVQTQVTQVDLVTLVSQVGGGLGLFLGFSIMGYMLGFCKLVLRLK